MKPVTTKERVRCRPIGVADLDAVAALLAQGFGGRPAQYFRDGLNRMAARDVPEGAQRFGYCLDTGSRLAGAILLIAAEREVEGQRAVFCNVASWYVLEEFRAYAQLIVSIALRNKDFTYTNVSPAPHTWSIVENQGYTRYCNGLFFAAAALARPLPGIAIEAFDAERHAAVPDHALLSRHAAMGCTVVVAREDDRLDGLVFRRYRIRSGRLPLPAMFALHAPSHERLVALAGNLGRHFLLTRAAPFLVMDAQGPVAGLRGIYTERRGRKYFKGPHRPSLAALADSEYAIFGF